MVTFLPIAGNAVSFLKDKGSLICTEQDAISVHHIIRSIDNEISNK